jgi:hypothetical protein
MTPSAGVGEGGHVRIAFSHSHEGPRTAVWLPACILVISVDQVALASCESPAPASSKAMPLAMVRNWLNVCQRVE